MTQQSFKTVDVAKLEVAITPTTPYNLVVNPSGELGAWGWVTPGASYLRKRAGENALEHVAAGTNTVFYTEPMPVTAGHYAAAAWSASSVGSTAMLPRLEWLDSSYAVIGQTAQGSFVSGIGNYSLPPSLAPAGTTFFRLRFDMATAGTGRVANVRAATATTAAALTTTITNLVTNPSFEVNTTGWTPGTNVTLSRTTVAAHVGTASLSMVKTTPNPGFVWADTIVPVTSGETYTLEARYREGTAGGFARTQIAWLASGGSQISVSYTQGPTPTGNAAFGAPVVHTATAPSNAVEARLTTSHSVQGASQPVYVDAVSFVKGNRAPANYGDANNTYFDGTYGAFQTVSYAWTGTAHASTSTRSDTLLLTLAEVEWTNILGPTHTISTSRESLNVGTLDAELLDATLDPATSSTLRPGGGVRLTALVDSVWEPLFVGTIDRLTVQYDDKRTTPRPPRVTLTATDHTRRLSSARRTEGVAAVASLPYVLEGAGVPWNVDGSTQQLLTNPAAVSLNDNATALDQIALTRDSTAAHAWVDRKGVLVATTTTGASVRTLDEPRYSDLEVAFSSEACINAVEIEALTLVQDTTPSGGVFYRTEPVTYGPYEDAVSIAQWGRRVRRFTVHGLDAAQVATLAQTILTRNANPGVSVQSVTLPMRTTPDLDDLRRDLGEIVTVTNTARGIAPTLRVTSVRHTIDSSPAKWLVELGFTHSGSVAAPTLAPEVQQAPAGFPDTQWTNLPMRAEWSAYAGGADWQPRYRRVGGIVYIQGLVTPQAGKSAFGIADMPVGFRPNKYLMVTHADANVVAKLLYLRSDGLLYYPNGLSHDAWANVAITYPADQ